MFIGGSRGVVGGNLPDVRKQTVYISDLTKIEFGESPKGPQTMGYVNWIATTRRPRTPVMFIQETPPTSPAASSCAASNANSAACNAQGEASYETSSGYLFLSKHTYAENENALARFLGTPLYDIINKVHRDRHRYV